MSESPKDKPHPLAHPLPGWVGMFLNNPGLRQEYEDYLLSLLSVLRDQQDNAEDPLAFAKIRGGVNTLKGQLAYVSNWAIEKKRRESHDEPTQDRSR